MRLRRPPVTERILRSERTASSWTCSFLRASAAVGTEARTPLRVGDVDRLTDAELIAAARSQPHAIAELYRRHSQAINSWFRSRVPTPDASELTAETFAQATLSLRRYRDPGHGSAAPWLFGIAKNLARRYYERQRVESSARLRLGMPLRSYEEDVAEQLDERDRATRLRKPLDEALQSMPPGQRDAVLLRVVDELPYATIARRLNCSEAAVRIKVMRALNTLSRMLRGEST